MSDTIPPSNKEKKIDNPASKGVDYRDDKSLNEIHAPIVREKDDPEEGEEPVSLWLVVAGACVVFAAGIYLGTNSGNFKADYYYDGGPGSDAGASAAASAAAVASADPTAKLIKRGKRIYTSNCASCHQATGLGAAGMYPPVANSNWVTDEAPKRLVGILLKGLVGPISINGGPPQSYSGAMASWEKMLSDKDIAAVLTYMRQEWGNSAPPITPEEVAMMRDQMADRSKAWTEPELLEIPAGPISGGSEDSNENSDATNEASTESPPA
ncbi:MAG: cytochrome c [Verrucomicrobiota bacterium]